MWSVLQEYAKKKLLQSKYIAGFLSNVIENILCTFTETIVLGIFGFFLKNVLSPWTITDIVVVDIGMSVTYTMLFMEHVRPVMCKLFEKHSKKVARKILGLDFKDKWAFLKMKYMIMVFTMSGIIVSVHVMEDIPFFVKLVCLETFCIQACLDAYAVKQELKNYVEHALESKPKVRILQERDLVVQQPTERPEKKEKVCSKQEILGSLIIDDHLACTKPKGAQSQQREHSQRAVKI